MAVEIIELGNPVPQGTGLGHRLFVGAAPSGNIVPVAPMGSPAESGNFDIALFVLVASAGAVAALLL